MAKKKVSDWDKDLGIIKHDYLTNEEFRHKIKKPYWKLQHAILYIFGHLESCGSDKKDAETVRRDKKFKDLYNFALESHADGNLQLTPQSVDAKAGKIVYDGYIVAPTEIIRWAKNHFDVRISAVRGKPKNKPYKNTKSKGKSGRPEKYDWISFHKEVRRIEKKDGLPEKKEALISIMSAWCEKEWAAPPGRTSVQKQLNKYY